ncbi:MauE/DoxX family redox-associated membrane protein [Chitinophaga sp. OAE865]|uniref:MauE/DoxX family redox-associated membrane protein n=1 Tax=Chitinophaga sp. OAE865 TaxID=2817898 RepID=UPI001AE872C8
MDQLSSLLTVLLLIGCTVLLLVGYLFYKGKNELALEILIAALVILFIYTPVSKLMKVDRYISSMKAQPLYPSFRNFLIYALPAVEFITVIILAIPKYRKIGLYISLAMLITFTGYISLIQLNYYGRIPCSCGGVISALEWKGHLLFNLYFVAINIWALWINRRIELNIKKGKPLRFSAG